MGDRLDWIKDKVSRNLNIPSSTFDELLEREAPTGKSYWAELNAFFEIEHAHEAMVVFHAEEVQDEAGKITFFFGWAASKG
jgi:hypothetical protein